MMFEPPTSSWVLAFSAFAAVVGALAVSRSFTWAGRLATLLAVGFLSLGLVWVSVYLTFAQRTAEIPDLLDRARAVDAAEMKITPGQVTIRPLGSEQWIPLRPKIKPRLPGGATLPFIVEGGFYAPLGLRRIKDREGPKGSCRFADIAPPAADGSLPLPRDIEQCSNVDGTITIDFG